MGNKGARKKQKIKGNYKENVDVLSDAIILLRNSRNSKNKTFILLIKNL